MRERGELAERLYQLVKAAHEECGAPVEERLEFFSDDDWEFHPAGRSGVVAFRGDYYMVALAPGERSGSGREVLKILRQKLREVGKLRSTVYHRNWRSAMATKRLGAVLLGMDEDGFFHYELTKEGFRHG